MAREVRDLIRRMSSANPPWGSPRILGELSKIASIVAKSIVVKYMVRKRKPPSPTWNAFLKKHVNEIAAIDFFVRPTVRNPILFVFLVLSHDRRRVLNERHLRRVVGKYLDYCRRSRTHLSLEMDCPEHREIHEFDRGHVVEIAKVDGLHHHYQRQAAR